MANYPQHEHAARAAKVARLAEAFRRHAAAAGADTDTLVAGLAQAADDSLFVALAEGCGVRPPSATTIEAMRSYLRIAADQADGTDPFASFSR